MLYDVGSLVLSRNTFFSFSMRCTSVLWSPKYYDVHYPRYNPLTKSIICLGVAMTNAFFPYLVPHFRTKAVAETIKDITSRGESPFARSDSGELLKKISLRHNR